MSVRAPEFSESYTPATVTDVQAAVLEAPRLLLRGAGTKPGLSRGPATSVLHLARLAGVLEYDPGEFVFTALAGTPLVEVEAQLAQHGQYLPFTPPLAARGATLGGTVAAGLSGAGRQRYGGLRDFLIGARFVDGQGRLVRSGGKVVKNAAGFDQHKLLVGSLGRLGVLVEVSFKVFPQPQAYGTLRVDAADVPAGVALLRRLATTRFDLEALDLQVNDPQHAAGGNEGAAVLIRLGGRPVVLPQRLQMLATWLGAGVVDEAADAAYWRAGDTFGWLPGSDLPMGLLDAGGLARGWSLVKTPLTLDRLAPLDGRLAAHGARRRYSGGGNLAWIGWPGDLAPLEAELTALGLGGLVVLGITDTPLIGVRNGQNLAQRVKATLDPHNKFLPLA
jgi:glycolate oxidase FAD binding subunit